MFKVLSGAYNFSSVENEPVSHPCDVYDLRRCYLLLELIPEWKDDLYKMKEVSLVWNKLIDNWEQFMPLLEERMCGRKNDLLERMKAIGC